MPETIELAVRGIAIGAVLAIGATLVRSAPTPRVRIVGAAFALSTACYAITASQTLRAALSPAEPIIFLLSCCGVAFFWLFVQVLFEDGGRWRAIEAAPFAVLIPLALAGAWSPPAAARQVWVVHNAAEIVVAAHAALTILRGAPGDLVAARRRLRGPFFVATCLYSALLSVGEIAALSAPGPLDGDMRDALALAAFCLAGAGAFLQPRASLFGAAPLRPAEAGLVAAADHAPLTRLAEIIDAQEGWRREGLTIGALADEVGVPEHRLRRLINDQLGHRNFADYLNARRIEAAKRALSDRAAPVASISALAFSLGFGSLGPFNRAFKEATGLTPSAWRAQALSPNPEIPA
ncbi:MAG: helix-turn-helix domain-containing protein [Alphaproteobacteria bacterium]|nr:helix-turn-helix domain-containing protein [Alphaproteobacteria bacterium]